MPDNNPYNPTEGFFDVEVIQGYGLTFESVQAWLVKHNKNPEPMVLNKYFNVNSQNEIRPYYQRSMYFSKINKNLSIQYFNSGLNHVEGLIYIYPTLADTQTINMPSLNQIKTEIYQSLLQIFYIEPKLLDEFNQYVFKYTDTIDMAEN